MKMDRRSCGVDRGELQTLAGPGLCGGPGV
jgi:hypothetical protein